MPAILAYTDHEIGRVIQEVEDKGKLDNTLIIYIDGDNGTAPRARCFGTPNRACLQRHSEVPVETQLKNFYNAWGSSTTYPHMAVGWAWAFDTPFRWTKQIASHFGGTRQGMGVSWPKRIKDTGGIRSQFHHVIDIVPTLLEVTGIQAPDSVNGTPQKPIEGVSMAYTFDKANANAPSRHRTQYFEMFGDRRSIMTAGLPAPRRCGRPGTHWANDRGPGQRLQVGAVRPVEDGQIRRPRCLEFSEKLRESTRVVLGRGQPSIKSCRWMPR